MPMPFPRHAASQAQVTRKCRCRSPEHAASISKHCRCRTKTRRITRHMIRKCRCRSQEHAASSAD
eukprot:24251-Heterocapsa_arctica.AAC.1